MERIKRNGKIKIISLVAAIILWSFVISEVNPPTVKEYRGIPVTMVNTESLTNQDLVVVSPKLISVDVELKGQRNIMSSVTNSDLLAAVDLKGYTEGVHTIPVAISSPPETTVTKVEDRNISFVIEKKIQRTMDISVETTGSLPDNLILQKTIANPAKISIEGARSLVEKVDRIVAKIDVSELSSDSTVNVSILPMDNEGVEIKGLNLGQAFVNVAISMAATREVPIVFSTSNEVPEDMKITRRTLSPEKIIITGEKDAVNSVASINTKKIDLSQVTQNTTGQIDLELPEGIVLLDPDRTITYNIEVDSVTTKALQLAVKDVELKNMDSAYDYTLTNPEGKIDITVSGYASQINEITANSLAASVNVEGLLPGPYTLEIGINPISGVTIESIAPAVIGVRIGAKSPGTQ